VEEYVRTIKPTKSLTIEFPIKVKYVVRICAKYVSHANSSNCSNCIELPHLECVIHTCFKCDDAKKCTENLKYVERDVSGTNVITYLEYLTFTQSMSGQ
jgi:hypothetical protein